jgi:hypothetical protein
VLLIVVAGADVVRVFLANVVVAVVNLRTMEITCCQGLFCRYCQVKQQQKQQQQQLQNNSSYNIQIET